MSAATVSETVKSYCYHIILANRPSQVHALTKFVKSLGLPSPLNAQPTA